MLRFEGLAAGQPRAQPLPTVRHGVGGPLVVQQSADLVGGGDWLAGFDGGFDEVADLAKLGAGRTGRARPGLHGSWSAAPRRQSG